MFLSSCLPSLITFLNVCILYRVGPVGGYEQEPELEVLVNPQSPSFAVKQAPVHIDLGLGLYNCLCVIFDLP
jgi:hypothetical protein